MTPELSPLRAALWAVATAALALTSRQALADPNPSLDLRGFNPPTDPASGLQLEPARCPDTLEWNAALWTSYAYRPITLRDPATGDVGFDVIEHQLSGDLVANVGIARRLALGLDLPWVLMQMGDDANAKSRETLGEFAVPRQAVGDLKLVGKLTLVPPTNDELGGFALGLHERVGIPIGDGSSFVAEGHASSETRLLVEYSVVAMSVHAATGIKFRDHEPFGCAQRTVAAAGEQAECLTTFGHEIPWSLGVAFRPRAVGIDDAGRWTWFAESYGYLPAGPEAPFTREALSQAQVALGARYAVGDVSLLGAVEAALLGGIGTAPFRATLALGWAPRKHDADDDGVHDDRDKCPDLQEDRDGHEDHDGCPDWDDDGDGVPDDEDRCQGELEDEDYFEDEDGCPDPDNDADGIRDDEDACPDQAGIPSADPIERGCPPPTADGPPSEPPPSEPPPSEPPPPPGT